jgi:hypothetical protein
MTNLDSMMGRNLIRMNFGAGKQCRSTLVEARFDRVDGSAQNKRKAAQHDQVAYNHPG